MNEKILKFFFPSLDRKYLVRLAAVAVSAYVFFGWICIPMRINGKSMEPTYRDGGINFCWRPSYLFSKPKKTDVVMVRFSGDHVMLLKRIVAKEGETVEFRKGKLFVDGQEVDEPYIKYPCDWNSSPSTVKKGNVYVVGDNRDVPSESHQFGQTQASRIRGRPLW